MTPIRATDPITCAACDHTGGIDSFDCAGLPDGMVFCPACLSVIEVATGAVVDDDDLEVRSGEV